MTRSTSAEAMITSTKSRRWRDTATTSQSDNPRLLYEQVLDIQCHAQHLSSKPDRRSAIKDHHGLGDSTDSVRCAQTSRQRDDSNDHELRPSCEYAIDKISYTRTTPTSPVTPLPPSPATQPLRTHQQQPPKPHTQSTHHYAPSASNSTRPSPVSPLFPASSFALPVALLSPSL